MKCVFWNDRNGGNTGQNVAFATVAMQCELLALSYCKKCSLHNYGKKNEEDRP